MTPESIVTSLEWSKKLKEAGWPQDTVHIWYPPTRQYTDWKLDRGGSWDTNDEQPVAAPTAEEILRRLPKTISGSDFEESDEGLAYLQIKMFTESCCLIYETAYGAYPIIDKRSSVAGIGAATLANAVAAMWLYLKDNELLPDSN